MNTKALFASLILLCVVTHGMTQTQTTPPPPPPPIQQLTDQDDVVKINTNLVQVDAVVTKNGKQVPDLKAEDFEIFEDGKRYRPTDETFNRKFHRVSAKVKRSGMTLRTRYGFYGYSEEDAIKRPQPKTNLALMSPFGAQDITVDFTTFFANDKKAGSVIRSFLYLDAKELTFVKTNEKHEANIELHGVIFGDNGVIAEQINHRGVLSLADKDYEQAVREGIRIRFDMPAKKPGAYQVRVAAHDVTSSRVGSAGQFVAVPDLKKKRLAASGIVLLSVAEFKTETGEVATASPAVRRFRPNSDLHFAFVVYNALLDRASGRPNLIVESKLFHDGKRVTSYPETPIDVSNQTDLDRIFVNRMIKLGADLEPGYYYLQLVITDRAGGEKPPVTVQWVDFEITR